MLFQHNLLFAHRQVDPEIAVEAVTTGSFPDSVDARGLSK